MRILKNYDDFVNEDLNDFRRDIVNKVINKEKTETGNDKRPIQNKSDQEIKKDVEDNVAKIVDDDVAVKKRINTLQKLLQDVSLPDENKKQYNLELTNLKNEVGKMNTDVKTGREQQVALTERRGDDYEYYEFSDDEDKSWLADDETMEEEEEELSRALDADDFGFFDEGDIEEPKEIDPKDKIEKRYSDSEE